MSGLEHNADDLAPLFDRLRSGDRTAESDLIRSVDLITKRFVHLTLGRHPSVRRWEESGDIVQDFWLKMTARGLFEPQQLDRLESAEHFRRYVLRACATTIIDQLRHYEGSWGLGKHHQSDYPAPDESGRPRSVVEGNPDSATGPAEFVARADFLEWACSQLEGMDEAYRIAFELVVFQGYSDAEAGRRMGLDPKTVKAKVKTVMRRLESRHLLDEV